MKTQLLVCVLVCIALTKAVAGVVTDIPPSSQVILDSSNSHAFFTIVAPAHTWMPTIKQTQESLPVIQTFLENSTDENKVTAVLGAKSPQRRTWIAAEIKKILANKDGYRVQFWGDMRDGKKIIVCNFFPTADSKDRDEFPNWRKQEASVCDGGYAFWNIAYDPASKSVLNFDSNGYARNDRVETDPLFAYFQYFSSRDISRWND